MKTHLGILLTARFVATFTSVVLMACTSGTIDPLITVTGGEYGLAAPDSLNAGWTRFRFARDPNAKLPHEVAIGRVRKGVTLEQARDAELNGTPVDSIYDEGDGLLFADVGEHVDAELFLNLEAGRTYMLICGLDAPDGKSHAQHGMVHAITVRSR